MFFDGDLQFAEGGTPAMTLFIDGAGAEFPDFVLQPAAWHSDAPSARKRFPSDAAIVRGVGYPTKPGWKLRFESAKDAGFTGFLLCLQSLQMSPKVVL